MSLVRRKGNSHSLRSDPFSLTGSLAHQGLSEVLGHKAGPQFFPTKARPELGAGGSQGKSHPELHTTASGTGQGTQHL